MHIVALVDYDVITAVGASMNLMQLIEEMEKRGIKLVRIDGDHVIYMVPTRTMLPEWLHICIRRHRAALYDILLTKYSSCRART